MPSVQKTDLGLDLEAKEGYNLVQIPNNKKITEMEDHTGCSFFYFYKKNLYGSKFWWVPVRACADTVVDKWCDVDL